MVLPSVTARGFRVNLSRILTFRPPAPPRRARPGAPPRPPGPARAQGWGGPPGTGILAPHGGSRPRPIASRAKIMPAYVALRDPPLRPGRAGPRLAVTPA